MLSSIECAMNKLTVFCLGLCLVLAGCRDEPPGLDTAPSSTPTAMISQSPGPPSATPNADSTSGISVAFNRTLELQGHTFKVESANRSDENSVSIKANGLDQDNVLRIVKIQGIVTGAEVADLDSDGFPELYIYTRAGEKANGNVVALASEEGRALVMVSGASLSKVAEVRDIYAGGDEFSILEGRLRQRFPVYREGEPTGESKQVEWRLERDDTGWRLVFDNVRTL